MKLDYVEHTFGMGHTIEAVIRLYNRQDLDKSIIQSLVDIFNSTNRDSLPPKLGQRSKIPVFINKE